MYSFSCNLPILGFEAVITSIYTSVHFLSTALYSTLLHRHNTQLHDDKKRGNTFMFISSPCFETVVVSIIFNPPSCQDNLTSFKPQSHMALWNLSGEEGQPYLVQQKRMINSRGGATGAASKPTPQTTDILAMCFLPLSSKGQRKCLDQYILSFSPQ